jgi:RNA polymerase sigma-70 factor (ECF subfamily)
MKTDQIHKSGQGHERWERFHDRTREQALVAAAQAGLTDAMDELLVRHRTVLYRAAKRFTRNHEDAEDLVQDAMLRAFVNVRRFRNESQFSTWLIAIANNAALSMKRKGKNVCYLSLDCRNENGTAPNAWEIPDGGSTPEQTVIHQELLAILEAVVLRQSQTHQAILKQCIFNEARIQDAASTLGLTIASAKSSLFRAKRRVSESFERRGFGNKRPLQETPCADERLKDAENL